MLSTTFLPNVETDHPTTQCHMPEDLNPQAQKLLGLADSSLLPVVTAGK
jgi:hypothetical protein